MNMCRPQKGVLYLQSLRTRSQWVKQHQWDVCQEAALSYNQLSVASSLSKTVDRLMFTLRGGFESYYTAGCRPETKCHCVIYDMLQANEINRAWIDSVGQEPSHRGICSCLQWLYWHAHIHRASERDPKAAVLAGKRKKNCAVSSFYLNWAALPSAAIRVDAAQIKRLWWDLTSRVLTAEQSLLRKAIFSSKTNKIRVVCSRQLWTNRWAWKSILNCS